MIVTLIILSVAVVAVLTLYIKDRNAHRQEIKSLTTTAENLRSDIETLTERLRAAEDSAQNSTKDAEQLRHALATKDQETNRLKSSLESHKMRHIDTVQNLITLQHTIYTDPGHIKALFSDFFLLHKPFETVGGDFYKFLSDGERVLVACGNCGVSGAAGLIKGIQNVALIEEIVHKNGLAGVQAGEVLDALRTKFAHIAEREGMRRDADEDMPVNFTICIINQKERTLSYAGAYGSLCLIRKAYPGTSRREVDVHEFRGDRMNFAVSFGRRKNYTTETIDLEKDDKLYLKTDGYANQRGGSSNGRYGDQYLRQLLMKHANEPMLEQKKAFEQEFENWRGNNRGNDILVIGLALKVAGK